MNGFSTTRRRGFTLVELLVVIGIIAVLIAILMPVLSRVRKSGNTAVCMSNLRQIGIALREYAVDNRDTMPPGYIEYSDFDRAWWLNFTNSYIADAGTSRGTTIDVTKVYVCPEGTVPDRQNYYTGHPVIFPDYTIDLEQNVKPAKFAKLRSDNIMATDGAQYPDQDFVACSLCYNLDEGFFFAGYYYIGTSVEELAQDQWYFDPTDPYKNDPTGGNDYPIQPGLNNDTNDNLARVRWRHRDSKAGSKNGYANFLFADGRVETLGQGDVLRKMLLLNR